MSEDDERLRTPTTSTATDRRSARLRHHPCHQRRQLFHPHNNRFHHHHHHHQQQQQQRDAGRRVCRKYRQVYIRNLQQQEYNKLLNIVPSLASSHHKQRIPKVTVIEETIRYIDQLHEALAERVESETGGRLKITTEAVADAAKDMFVEDATAAAAAASAAAGTIPSSTCGSKCAVCETERSPPKTKSSASATCSDT